MERTHGEGSGHPADCFGCRIGDGPMISPQATPTRTRSSAPPKRPGNSWELGRVTDDRGLPVTGADGHPLGVKTMADDRHRIEKRLKEVRDPNYWASQNPSHAVS